MNQLEKIGDYIYELIEKWHLNENVVEHEDKIVEIVIKLARYNYDLWHEEDKARDVDASDSVIAQVKRNIDKLNQNRNNTIEELDEEIMKNLQDVSISEEARLNSETPGSIIDRISINALKIYHMKEQTLRKDASGEHINKCKEKLFILREQAKDLQKCLNELIDDLQNGRKYMKIYRQMKMYNDPTLNPVLYGKNKV